MADHPEERTEENPLPSIHGPLTGREKAPDIKPPSVAARDAERQASKPGRDPKRKKLASAKSRVGGLLNPRHRPRHP
jgi:hypothetical protein